MLENANLFVNVLAAVGALAAVFVSLSIFIGLLKDPTSSPIFPMIGTMDASCLRSKTMEEELPRT